MNSQQEDRLNQTFEAVQRIETVLTGDKFNEKGLIECVKDNKESIKEIKTTQVKQKNTTWVVIATATVVSFIIGLAIKIKDLV